MTSKTRATITPEQEAQLDEVLGFEEEPSGSLAPMDANQGKWTKHCDAAALSELAQIQIDVNATVEDTVQAVARARLKVGRLLNEARAKFPGDKEFGQWRKACLPNLASSTCNQYQRMANEYSNAPAVVEAMGWNVAAELMNKPALQLEALDRPDTEKMTVKEARSKKKETSELPTRSTSVDSKAPPPSQIMSPQQKAKDHDFLMAQIIDSSLPTRIAAVIDGELDHMDEYSRCAIIFGFGPDLCDCKPNLDVWLAVYDFLMKGADEESARILDQAYSKMKEAWS